MSPIQNLRRSLVRKWRPVCSAVGAAVLGAEPAPHPPHCLLPPAGLGRSAAGYLLWTCSVPLFCERLAVCLGRLIFSLLLSHSLSWYLTKAPSDCPQGPWAGPHPKQCRRSSPFSPHFLVVDAGISGTFPLGVAFRHLICGFYLFFPSQIGCPPRFENFPQTRQGKGFLVIGNFLY